MSEIRINKLSNYNVPQKKVVKEEVAQEKNEVKTQPELKHKNADEILDFMANSAGVGKSKSKNVKKVEVSKYVNAEQANRIKESVTQAFGALLAYEESFIKEFGLPKEAAEDAAIMAFGQKYLV